MLKKIVIYIDEEKNFIALHINEDGTFRMGPFSEDIHDVGKILARISKTSLTGIEEQLHITFPNETVIYHEPSPKSPIVRMCIPIKSQNLVNGFYNAYTTELGK